MGNKAQKLVVLDRDGTLNVDDLSIIASPDDWRPLPGALEAVARLNQAGWRVVIATNQSGLGRGLFDMSTMNAVHTKMHKQLSQVGARIDAVFFCPHSREDACDCRKPESGLFVSIAQRFGVAPEALVVVGNTVRHVVAGDALGAATHLLLSGKCAAYTPHTPPPGVPTRTRLHLDLAEFVDDLLTSEHPSEVSA